jgi:acetylornithine deacetylase/succinyl-diaminopimelate desuccinylase-like protein
VTGTLLDDILELASVPAPTFAEERRLAWLERKLSAAPGHRERDAAGNLIWACGEGAPQVLVLAHVDTVFPENVPLTFEISDGRVVGPGIGDNAAAVVAVVHAVPWLLSAGPTLPFAVAFTVGEEGLGDLRGAHEACERLGPSRVLAVEGHGLDHVIVDAVGSVRLSVRISGPGGHSWQDRGTPSAVHAVLSLGSELVGLATPDAPVNVGLVSGGQSINSIAAEAELVVERRALDEEPLARFEEQVRELAAAQPLTAAVERVGRRPAGRLDRNDRILETVRRLRCGLDLPDELTAGSTDANAALARGIPALTLGVGRGGRMHTTEEWLEVSSLELGLRQLEATLDALLRPT